MNTSLNFVVRPHFGPDKAEWMIFAEVPSEGGDGALVAVYDSEHSARIFAAVMNSATKMHQGAALHA